MIAVLSGASARADSHRPLCACETPDFQAELRQTMRDRRDSLQRAALQAPLARSRDLGTVAVIEDDGTMIQNALLVMERVVQEFVATHDDSVDVICIYLASNHPTNLELGFNAFAYQYTVRREDTGIGRLLVDNNADLGIDTQRLLSVTAMNDLDDYDALPTDLLPTIATPITGIHLLAHEFLHQWAAWVNAGPVADLLAGGGNWSKYLNGEASVLYSPTWQDNLDGTFTVLEHFRNYSRLDRYLLGALAPEDVDPSFVIQSADVLPSPLLAGATISGTRLDFTINDVIVQNGPRVPDYLDAQHDFRIATVLVVPWGTDPVAEDLTFMDALATAWPAWFSDQTDEVASVDATLPQTAVHADFAADATHGNGPHTVRFRDRSWGTVTGRTWDFGDGSPTSVGAPNDATTGNWERGDPETTIRNGYVVQPEDDHSASGTQAWVTGLAAGALPTTFDVDGGTTTLYSPILDLSGTVDPYVSYARWYCNNAGSHPYEDSFSVEVSGDGGGSWEEVETVAVSSSASSGYTRVQFRLSDLLAPTATVQFRFLASDPVWPSLVEAAIDDFEVLDAVATPVPEPGPLLVDRARLDAARPNPFRGSTTVRFALPSAAEARLAVYDAAGRRVRTLVTGAQGAGEHSVEWDGRDAGGAKASSGVYWVRLESGNITDSRRIVLLR
jgi:hypothetical protein